MAKSLYIAHATPKVVVSLGMIEGKLLLGACQMKTSLKNLLENNQVSIVAKQHSQSLPHQAILVRIQEVVDLDKQVRLL